MNLLEDKEWKIELKSYSWPPDYHCYELIHKSCNSAWRFNTETPVKEYYQIVPECPHCYNITPPREWLKKLIFMEKLAQL